MKRPEGLLTVRHGPDQIYYDLYEDCFFLDFDPFGHCQWVAAIDDRDRDDHDSSYDDVFSSGVARADYHAQELEVLFAPTREIL